MFLPDTWKSTRLLIEQEKYIKEVKSSILQQAVQGKLASQDPNDEPASELLRELKEHDFT